MVKNKGEIELDYSTALDYFKCIGRHPAINLTIPTQRIHCKWFRGCFSLVLEVTRNCYSNIETVDGNIDWG